MFAQRALVVGVILTQACGEGDARPPRAAPPAERTEQGAADAEGAAADSEEAPADAGSADAEPRDATTSMVEPAMDAGTASDTATNAVDARTAPDAQSGAARSVDGGMASSCVARLCKADQVTVLALEQDQPWNVGALGWVGLVCGRALSWPVAATSDARQHLYLVTHADIAAIEAGGRVQTFYGNPDALSSALPSLNCNFEPASTLPACRSSLYPGIEPSFAGCRAPSARGCAVCRAEHMGVTSYRSASAGSDWYNVSSEDAAGRCADGCPPCAACSERDQTALQALSMRPECLPCESQPMLDPCHDPGSCGCWCSQWRRLSAACPTLVSDAER